MNSDPRTPATQRLDQAQATLGFPQKCSHLVVSKQVQVGVVYYIVKNPAFERIFKLREVEFFILQQMNGRNSLFEIHQRVVREFADIEMTLEDVSDFTDTLKEKGLLEGTGTGVSEGPPWWSKVLFWRKSVLNPDSILDRMAPFFAPTFERKFVVSALAVMLFSLYLFFNHRNEYFEQSESIINVWGFILFYFLLVVTGFVHEFGHAVCCKHFGGRVTEIGFLFMYFQPCFYANVNDAWLFQEKYKKIWVGVAGLYFEFMLGALSIFVWLLTFPGTFLHHVAHIVIGCTGLWSLFNLNPLIKLDGYYLLSDALEISNLRGKSFDYISSLFKRNVLGIQDETALEEAKIRFRREGSVLERKPTGFATKVRRGYVPVARKEYISPREKRIYLWYGVLAFAYTAFFLTAALFLFLKFLVRRFLGLGFILFLAIFFLWLGRPISQAIPYLFFLAGRWKQSSMIAKLRWIVAGIILFIILGSLFLIYFPLVVHGTCRVEPWNKQVVSTRVGGVLAEVKVREGDKVSEHSVIGSLENVDLRNRLKELKIEAQTLRVKADILRKETELLRTRKASALKKAEAEYDQSRIALREHTAVGPHYVAEQEKKLAQARDVRTRLEKDYNNLLAGRHPPAFQAISERIEKNKVESWAALQKYQRARKLLDAGAVSAQALEEARSVYEALEREGKSLKEDFLAKRKELAEHLRDAVEEERYWEARYASTSRENLSSKPAALRQDILTREAQYTQARKEEDEIALKNQEIRLNELALEQATHLISATEQKLRATYLVAPISGTVITPRVHEKVGKYFGKGDEIFWISDSSKVLMEVDVQERDLEEVAVGNQVRVKVLALPGEIFLGKVLQISPTTTREKLFSVVRVKILVDNASGHLLLGMTGTAKLDTRRRSLAYMLGRRASNYLKYNVWSWFP